MHEINFASGSSPYQIVADLLAKHDQAIKERNNSSLVLRGECQIFPNPLSTSYSLMNQSLLSHSEARDEWARVSEWNQRMRQLGQNSHLKSDWETLVEAQHFGLKTRLLDWTINPLMALWIACDGHSRTNTGLDYQSHFDNLEKNNNNQTPDGAIYFVHLPYAPVIIDGQAGRVTINGKHWETHVPKETMSLTVKYDNPILNLNGDTPHDHYLVKNACGNNEKYSILFFRLGSMINSRVRSQSGLFSIHTPAHIKLSQKGDSGLYKVTKLTVPGIIKPALLEYLEKTLNLNVETFGLATPETIALEINNQSDRI